MLAKLNLGKQGADLCSSPVTQLFVAAYFQERDWREYLEQLKQLYRRRRDVMLEALQEHFGDYARWTRPQGGLFIWVTLNAQVDTTDLLADARKNEAVAFVPGRAAYMDGRSGSTSMRLNFAGVPDEDIREGVQRIGRVVREQVALFGTLADTPTPADTPSGAVEHRAASADPKLADIVELPQHPERGAARRRRNR